MSEILVDIFPLEVIDNIFLFLSEKALTTFCKESIEASVLRSIAISRIRKTISVHSLEGLVEAAKVDAPIGTMHLNYEEEYLPFLKENPSFVASIADVKLVVRCHTGYTVLEEILFRSISQFTVTNARCFDPSLVLRNLNLIEVSCGNDLRKLDGWPPTLSHLKIRSHGNLTLINLPKNLRELNCEFLDWAMDVFPPKLVKLSFHYIKGFPSNRMEFPETLKELLIRNCSVPDIQKLVTRLPSRLTKLHFDHQIGSKLSSLKFPDSIEVLNLSSCEIESLEGFKFPSSLVSLNLDSNRIRKLENLKFPETLRVLSLSSNTIRTLDFCEFPNLLRELYAGSNHFISMDRANFPELEVLDISTSSRRNIKSIRNVRFPSTLKVLNALGHAIKDCWRTSFPEGLKELRITVKGRPQRMSFPPELEILALTLPKSRKSKFAHLALPETLQKLEITNGRCIEFDWKLPHLQQLILYDFKGHLKVPLTVSWLEVSVMSGKWLKGLSIAHNLEMLDVICEEGCFNDDIDDIIENRV